MKFDVKNEIIIAGHRGNPAKIKGKYNRII